MKSDQIHSINHRASRSSRHSNNIVIAWGHKIGECKHLAYVKTTLSGLYYSECNRKVQAPRKDPITQVLSLVKNKMVISSYNILMFFWIRRFFQDVRNISKWYKSGKFLNHQSNHQAVNGELSVGACWLHVVSGSFSFAILPLASSLRIQLYIQIFMKLLFYIDFH